jgi:hypothetical protein
MTNALSVLALKVTLSNTGSLAVIAEPSFRNPAVGSVVSLPILTSCASIGTTCAPALIAWLRFRARSMIELAQTVKAGRRPPAGLGLDPSEDDATLEKPEAAVGADLIKTRAKIN